ncbi:hypothetical protein ZOSMA_292G00210 [Zostera marina]|uniref:Uncharacterized protein n=1 Tax=Zostera marina TaxID=29655 RepID=A0A0K9PCC4_ZOSMR|nr:hypothetical protein ZOSMA_292G00210 [Zostera marina]
MDYTGDVGGNNMAGLFIGENKMVSWLNYDPAAAESSRMSNFINARARSGSRSLLQLLVDDRCLYRVADDVLFFLL